MPLYEYQCDACAHRFELIQKFSDPPADLCPVCGGPVRKLLSSPAIHFKGTGWYITDYAQKGRSGDGAGEAPAGKGSGGNGTGDTSSPSSDSTPAGPAASGSADSTPRQS